ncbi:hypothetical protein [Phenylobacterium sp. LjRoot225]|uniref:hypothetical protein n=1 Tax=Phenylobacterium sp. LjRoot225 TaxID=3342285 RepID=UPI003F50292B
MNGRRDVADESAPSGAVVATPGKARPYAVVVCLKRVILRSEPVESIDQGNRLLLRLLTEAAGETNPPVEDAGSDG